MGCPLERRIKPHTVRRQKRAPMDARQILFKGLSRDGCIVGNLATKPPPIAQAKVSAKA